MNSNIEDIHFNLIDDTYKVINSKAGLASIEPGKVQPKVFIGDAVLPNVTSTLCHELEYQDTSYEEESWVPKIGRKTPRELIRKRNRARRKQARISQKRNRNGK